MVKRRYILIGLGVATLSIALIISRPYLVMLLEFAQMKQYVDVDHQAGLPDQLFDINDDVINNEIPTAIANYKSQPHADRNAYFGDLHVHTALSFDAYAFGTTASPSDAYRFAKGEAIDHPSGFPMQLDRPLDFYGVTDHALFLGLNQKAAESSEPILGKELSALVYNLNASDNTHWTKRSRRYLTFARTYMELPRRVMDGTIDKDYVTRIAQNAWLDIIKTADSHYDPGTFTTFVAYEYTTEYDKLSNLHRNVIFRSSKNLPKEPFSRYHSRNPEGLWDWMDGLRDQGIESLAIPHNSNHSNGQMFALEDWAGNPLDDSYAEQRMRNEPLVEITQVKGTSDTHPLLSKNDEWAFFEIDSPEKIGSYVRTAYLRGLSIEDDGVLNPYKFGLIGSSDTHVAASSIDETKFHSKMGVLDGQPEGRESVPITGVRRFLENTFLPPLTTEVEGRTYENLGHQTWGASGLAGVWAEENTREAIYDAFRRKETFATSGPRIKVRFFAGYDWTDEMLQSEDMVSTAYASGVPMGADLLNEEDKSPNFLVWAVRDSLGAPLQRVQIIKGYVRDGEHNEIVHDVACSDGSSPNPTTHRCADNGATVDLSDCSISTDRGADELITLWQDPEFNSAQDAFYYVRVLENPTCRWSTWDALRVGVERRPDIPATIEERAWSSPIWYVNADNITKGVH